MRIEFDKMEGAGNDFILIDNRDGRIPDAVKKSMAVDYCRRCFGVGADGMIFVEKDAELDFAWDFYNSDGSPAGMCGNGARCVARYAVKIGAAGESMAFRSLAGIIRATLTPGGAKVRLTDVALPAGAETIDVAGRPTTFWLLNSGVPHVSIRVDDVDVVDADGLGRLVRQHARFAPEGVNVNFFTLKSPDRLAIRTYERGVENETLACGTGSAATSIAAGRFLGGSSPMTVETRGGGDLIIHFELAGGMAENVYLEGGARRVFSGWLDA